jgi:adenylate cyclase
LSTDRVIRRLAAILAIDMVGYSRHVETDEAGTIARQKAHRRELIEPALRGHGGRVVKTTGDGMLVEFGSVVDALDAAVRIPRAVAEAAAGQPPDRRIQYRAGINLGDIVIDGDDILGDGVNIAARLEGMAEPGGISVTASVFDQVIGKLDLAFDDLGQQQLKNIQKPVRVYRVRQIGRAHV